MYLRENELQYLYEENSSYEVFLLLLYRITGGQTMTCQLYVITVP